MNKYLVFTIAMEIAIKAIKVMARRTHHVVQSEPQPQKVLLLEEYTHTTIEAYRSLDRNEWVTLKEWCHYEVKHSREYGFEPDEVSAFEFVGGTVSRDLSGRKPGYHDPDDGVDFDGIQVYPKWWPAGNGAYPRCGYRGFKPESMELRRLYHDGYNIGSWLHAADLDGTGGYPYPCHPLPSAKRISDGIDSVIARCPSANWKIGKEVK